MRGLAEEKAKKVARQCSRAFRVSLCDPIKLEIGGPEAARRVLLHKLRGRDGSTVD